MHNNIIFMGGIHGVGKGTICSEICPQFNLEHTSASEILKWNEVSPDSKSKQVKDINSTQERLINGLNRFVERDKKYILDGHFCLLNSLGEVSRIDRSVFEEINPIGIVVAMADAEIINERLKTRDNKHYDIDLLKTFQAEEIKYAREIAEYLNVPFVEINNGDYSNFINALTDNKFFV